MCCGGPQQYGSWGKDFVLSLRLYHYFFIFVDVNVLFIMHTLTAISVPEGVGGVRGNENKCEGGRKGGGKTNVILYCLVTNGTKFFSL